MRKSYSGSGTSRSIGPVALAVFFTNRERSSYLRTAPLMRKLSSWAMRQEIKKIVKASLWWDGQGVCFRAS